MAKIFLPLEVDFDDDEKVARFARYTKPGEARALRDLLVAMWRYCKREKTDGHVPAEIIGKLAYPDSLKIAERDVARIVECGLAERTPTGYFLPGYLKQPKNKSRAQIDAESEAKAKAGRIGGLASGIARSGEASMKQTASHENQFASEERSQSTEDRGQRSFEDLGEERPEPLRAVDATKPPPKCATPNEARCTAHAGVTNPGPCKGCMRERERAERQVDRELERQRVEEQRRALACIRCDGIHIIDDNQKPTRHKCDHRPLALAVARPETEGAQT